MEKIVGADLSSEPDVKDKEWGSQPDLESFLDYKKGESPSELADELMKQGKEMPLENWKGVPYLPEDEMPDEEYGVVPDAPLTEQQKQENYQKQLHDLLSGMPSREGNGYGSAIFDSEMAARGIAQPSLTKMIKQTGDADKLKNLLISSKMNQAASRSKSDKLMKLQQLKNEYNLKKAQMDAYGKIKMKRDELEVKKEIAKMNNLAKLAAAQAGAGGMMMSNGVIQNEYPELAQGIIDKILNWTPEKILGILKENPDIAKLATPEQQEIIGQKLGR
jgi:hypothetical protein